jgi:Fe-S-cluster containining protein
MSGSRRPTPHDDERARERALLTELVELYRDVDSAYSETRCPSSTECCRFGITGREPYVTSLELAALRRAVAARGGPLHPKRRALAIYDGETATERTCPMLDASGRCSVYAARPLGCRTFFCDRAESSGPPVSRSELAAFVRRLQELAARHERDGERGRPLTRALED